jgi:hypothetical protein
VVVDKALLLKSVNGPKATVIFGDSSVGDDAVRGVWLTNGAALIGFTLTNGGTRASGDDSTEQGGGGAWCQSAAVLISDCIVRRTTRPASRAGTRTEARFSTACGNCRHRAAAQLHKQSGFAEQLSAHRECSRGRRRSPGGYAGSLHRRRTITRGLTAAACPAAPCRTSIVYFNTAGMLGPNHYGSALILQLHHPRLPRRHGQHGPPTRSSEIATRADDYRLTPYASPCADIPRVIAQLAGPTDSGRKPEALASPTRQKTWGRTRYT